MTNAAVVFPGQGSQFAGMADAWTQNDASRTVLDDASAVIGRDIVEGCRDESALETTEFVQPALLAIDVGAFRALENEGVGFVGAAGHSLGEFAALVAAAVLDLDAALRIVTVRGRAMQAAGDERPGTMTALLGVRAVRLRVAGAFHSPLMETAVEPLGATIDAAEFRAPRFPIAANVTGELVADPEEIRALLKRHVVSPVRWESCVRSLLAAGAEVFVEAGPGDVLTRLAKRVVPGARAVAVGSLSEASALAAELR